MVSCTEPSLVMVMRESLFLFVMLTESSTLAVESAANPPESYAFINEPNTSSADRKV